MDFDDKTEIITFTANTGKKDDGRTYFMTRVGARQVFDSLVDLKPASVLPWHVVPSADGSSHSIMCDKEYFVLNDRHALFENLQFVTKLVNMWPNLMIAMEYLLNEKPVCDYCDEYKE